MQTLLKFLRNIRRPQDHNEVGWTEIHRATWLDNHNALIKSIKLNPSRLNEENIYGVTALHLAVRWNRIKCVDILLQQSHIDVNTTDEDGWTPLHDAARLGRSKCIEMLLNHPDINVNAVDYLNLTPVYMTTREGYAECMKLLLEKCPESVHSINFVGSNLLHNLVRYGRSDCLEIIFLLHDINVNVKDVWGNTPLHYAAIYGRVTCLNLLIDKGGADVNIVNKGDTTPLHFAIKYGKTQCALKLINCPNIDVNIRNQAGLTPLAYAVHCNDIPVITKLIDEKHADTNISVDNSESNNWTCWTCWHAAAALNKIDILKLLDDRNLINLYTCVYRKNTVLSYVFSNNKVLKFFKNMNDKYGLSLLQHAAIQRTNKLFKLLLKQSNKNKNKFNSRYTIKGRDAELQTLHSAIEKYQKVSIFGPGGMGKTTLAIFYAWSHQTFYKHSFFIDCQDENSIRKSFINVAKCLRIATKRYDTDRDLTLIVNDVFSDLKNKKSLITFDNITDNSINVIQKLHENTQIIFISRKNLFCDKEMPSIHLQPVSPDTAVEIFDVLFQDKILQANNRQHIELLSKILKYIPLCLITAKFYILQEYSKVDLEQYLTDLEDEQKKLLCPHINELNADETDKIIYSTLIVTLNKYKIYNLLAAAILLDPDYLDIKTFMRLGKILYPQNVLLIKVRNCIASLTIQIVNKKIVINRYVRNLILYHPYYKVNQNECYRYILKFLVLGDYSKHHEYVFKYGLDDNLTFIDSLLDLRSFEIIKPFVKYSYLKNLTNLFSCLDRNEIKEIVKKYKLLHEAIKSGNITTVKFIFQFDNNLKKSDDMGYSMIWEAIDKNYTDILNFLISQGASYKHIDKLNKTPLHRAAFLGKTEIVKLLLQKGLDPNVRNKFQRTPLHYAAMEGHNDVIEVLLQHPKININARDHYKRSPVFETVRCFQIESLKLFIRKGAKIKTKDNLDLSPVRLAKLQKHKRELLDIFKEHGFYEETDLENKCSIFIC